MSIGERLKEWRKENNLKITDICQATQISTGALSNYENDKRDISSTFLLKLKEIYNADIYYIFTGVKQEEEIFTENEKEMLQLFRLLPEREQIKMIGIIEEKSKNYAENKISNKLSSSKIG